MVRILEKLAKWGGEQKDDTTITEENAVYSNGEIACPGCRELISDAVVVTKTYTPSGWSVEREYACRNCGEYGFVEKGVVLKQ